MIITKFRFCPKFVINAKVGEKETETTACISIVIILSENDNVEVV